MKDWNPYLYIMHEKGGKAMRIGFSNDPKRQARRYPQEIDKKNSEFCEHPLAAGIATVIWDQFHSEYGVDKWGTLGGSQWYTPEAIPYIKAFIVTIWGMVEWKSFTEL